MRVSSNAGLQLKHSSSARVLSKGPTVNLEYFKSKDPNVKCPQRMFNCLIIPVLKGLQPLCVLAARFNWKRVVGRKIVFLFDTVDQTRFFEQRGPEKSPRSRDVAGPGPPKRWISCFCLRSLWSSEALAASGPPLANATWSTVEA